MDLVSRLKALIACFQDEAIADADLLGTARAALLLVALTRGETPRIRDFRSWLMVHAAPAQVVESPLARYLRLAQPVSPFMLVIWDEVAATGLDGEQIFEAIGVGLDQVEGEQLLTQIEAG